MTFVKYMMPDDDDYPLTQVADYVLPVTSTSNADIAPGSTLLWAVVDNQARHLAGYTRTCPLQLVRTNTFSFLLNRFAAWQDEGYDSMTAPTDVIRYQTVR